MYDKKDPRAQLVQEENKILFELTQSKYLKFYEQTELKQEKWARAQNFYIGYSENVEETTYERVNQLDEYMIILPNEDSYATIQQGENLKKIDGYSITIIPDGGSVVKVKGRMIRLITVLNEDLLKIAINHEDYTMDDPNVKKIALSGNSGNNSEIRSYSLEIPEDSERFGRIFVSSNFMVNFLYPKLGPRDRSKMSPHSHSDFEQCSFAIDGEYIHHLRWPWGMDANQWLEDQHEYCNSPSVAVIPAGVIHTSEAVGENKNQLIDIFCPPRQDFLNKEGWVLNKADYELGNVVKADV